MADDNTKSPSPDISEILGELLSNGELMAKIKGITDSQINEQAEEGETKGIDSLLSNPDIMSKLPEVISVIKPMLSSAPQGEGKSASHDRRMGLLIAMKPYLSPKRCEAIDYIARMSKLSETLKGLL